MKKILALLVLALVAWPLAGSLAAQSSPTDAAQGARARKIRIAIFDFD